MDGVGNKEPTKSLKVEMLMLEDAAALKDIVEEMKRVPEEGLVELGGGLNAGASVQRPHPHGFLNGKCRRFSPGLQRISKEWASI